LRLRGKVRWAFELLVRVEGVRNENPTWGALTHSVCGRRALHAERAVGRMGASSGWPAFWPGRGGGNPHGGRTDPTPSGNLRTMRSHPGKRVYVVVEEARQH